MASSKHRHCRWYTVVFNFQMLQVWINFNLKSFTYTWKTAMNTAAFGTALQKYSAVLYCTLLYLWYNKLISSCINFTWNLLFKAFINLDLFFRQNLLTKLVIARHNGRFKIDGFIRCTLMGNQPWPQVHKWNSGKVNWFVIYCQNKMICDSFSITGMGHHLNWSYKT